MLLKEYIFISLATVTLTQAIPWHVRCPDMCVCEIKPWFTPRSMYREAPTVDCNDFFMSKVPSNLPEGTQTLLLQSNRITKIEPGELHHLVNLTELDLSQNSFSQIEDFSLTNMSNLLVLHLEENQLTELSEKCFSALTNLQELYLNHNQLSTISAGAFFGLENLLRLHLNSNKLRTIKSEWFKAIPSLEILMIGENAVDKIQNMNFKPLINLRSLVLSGMRLKEISDYALEGLENLESISFYDNKLSKVPKVALQKVPGLKFLDLNKNSIQRIQQSDFTDMLHLKELGINNMEELISIDKFALDNLPELTKLEVTNNPKFSYIHPNAFRLIPQMETLMLNNNALSALYKKTIESLSKLQEISIHSNPIRCDCVIRWVNTNENHIRFIEPQSTFCVDPPEFNRRNLRDVPFREMTDRCLPLISPEAFPSDLSVEMEESFSLHCRAFAEPDPEIYWVTPSGDKLSAYTASDKYRVRPEGTLEIFNISTDEAGLYTCVAHNLVGADSKSVTIKVSGFYPENEDNIQLYVQEIEAHHILLSWIITSNIISSNITWSRTLSNSSLNFAFSARIPAGVHSYNLTRLEPLAEYVICVHVSHISLHTETSCLRSRTKETHSATSTSEIRPQFLIALTACALFVAISVLALRRLAPVRQKVVEEHRPLSMSMQRNLSISLHRIYPLFVKHWEPDINSGKTIAVELQSTPLGPSNIGYCDTI
ncbi:leucine-rich repeat neuronal protein 2 [Pristis pectinata]|uniref:leucine-rich repeat neuronal protein 2 n=1 Tax=Pristis pectinata TaxID=685728 RepID=UPI00223C9B95|nr:leucine-rich repeat neuronal protein 2 [Pristis pectinata]XP_051890945.1 leucine-rich repeat neuronal protein 2 [Pristis pectinata]XP_051890946.1 leucine-rich repeat neuronal protein 2 [Pristis pectinata]XP_051890947.1 leucine-rich repeat neuronal protein 2 [Pristis pectinata]XP_051890948.1 leucine-rich repeat neuronal protein 2 [Pristis pectinata]XP_051890949.1 leucine-rich repeat neuronal protein 2 [Pristis pectinata]XP_051890950.1 leucine-rich repeat neuronal protein 2 [Pristis pectinat